MTHALHALPAMLNAAETGVELPVAAWPYLEILTRLALALALGFADQASRLSRELSRRSGCSCSKRNRRDQIVCRVQDKEDVSDAEGAAGAAWLNWNPTSFESSNVGAVRTRFLPSRLASYNAASAREMS
jgi:hypothetical protein